MITWKRFDHTTNYQLLRRIEGFYFSFMENDQDTAAFYDTGSEYANLLCDRLHHPTYKYSDGYKLFVGYAAYYEDCLVGVVIVSWEGYRNEKEWYIDEVFVAGPGLLPSVVKKTWALFQEICPDENSKICFHITEDMRGVVDAFHLAVFRDDVITSVAQIKKNLAWMRGEFSKHDS